MYCCYDMLRGIFWAIDFSLPLDLSEQVSGEDLLLACAHRLRQHGEDAGNQVDRQLEPAVRESAALRAGGGFAHHR